MCFSLSSCFTKQESSVLSSDSVGFQSEQTDIGLSGAEISIKIGEEKNIEGIGLCWYINVRNSQNFFKFRDYVETSRNATWLVSSDVEGVNIIPTKTVELSIGHPATNLFYLFVQNEVENKYETYPVLFHRNDMFTVFFNTNCDVDCPSQQVEEGFLIDQNLIVEPAKEGYSFMGWDFDINSPITQNITINARFDPNQYLLFLDANGGVVSEATIVVTYNSKYYLPTPTRSGYVFLGWLLDSCYFYSGVWKYTSNKTIVAKWSIIEYNIFYTLNGGYNNPLNPSTYTVEDSFSFASPTRDGYKFIGWFDGGTIITGVQNRTGDLCIEARWSTQLNSLVVISQDKTKGSVSIVSGSGYTDETIVVEATPYSDNYFKGWYSDDVLISTKKRFSFTMPPHSYMLVALFYSSEQQEDWQEKWDYLHGVKPYVFEETNHISYGLYPQSFVNDKTLISELDKLDDSDRGINDWYFYEYEYYAKRRRSFDTHGNFNDGTPFEPEETYWFKCEPILWAPLNNRTYFSCSVLDCTIFNDDNSYNNYNNSSIRTWLNGEFLNCAFSLGSDYLFDYTFSAPCYDKNGNIKSYPSSITDKLFLLGYNDYCKEEIGLNTSDSRMCMATDWALLGHQYSCGSYWTRSPRYEKSPANWSCSWCIYRINGDLSALAVTCLEGVRPSFVLRP